MSSFLTRCDFEEPTSKSLGRLVTIEEIAEDLRRGVYRTQKAMRESLGWKLHRVSAFERCLVREGIMRIGEYRMCFASLKERAANAKRQARGERRRRRRAAGPTLITAGWTVRPGMILTDQLPMHHEQQVRLTTQEEK